MKDCSIMAFTDDFDTGPFLKVTAMTSWLMTRAATPV